jgi:hypothetical protein
MSETTTAPSLVALVYARRPDGSVLLVERRRPPFAGYWVATALADRGFAVVEPTLPLVAVDPRRTPSRLYAPRHPRHPGGVRPRRRRLPGRVNWDPIPRPEPERLRSSPVQCEVWTHWSPSSCSTSPDSSG